ncbi:MotA/TolQ/ExbB proton channel family protein [Leptospira wolffii]|uniref:MotA/TolQ/ExbB proton channel family protein n=1 Tax=Leptospira wolffii TaxID=409998 RepID=A0A2M9ZBP9_9LEPT|nr:MotA/TolQ/ExbB proton channel family protein [Leptospira wolffii]EPG66054.1 transporter, MotA/TolQ/ExbB proton channel family protein [Leptospira wolffii serovar Khorat str. Khorat-H2]PJZ65871.1 MotA/TolQ/ExbB proton channel family protein [Leptospira wolffii]TGK59409.1 MotA/TolQ/ExbB proton channel family protein [Leptospira wolffii]TGK71208.1 MotA/TolQ/ExbB proton channel family protein [Leptospira wolffii]TGK77776.1 MotA/TolQ/ExbB proton channel family protein [Leptospira wolffii]
MSHSNILFGLDWVSLLICLLSVWNLGTFLHVWTILPKRRRSLLVSFLEEPGPDVWEEKISAILFPIETKISWIKHLAGISTMLGLLGTVLGISEAFSSLQAAGTVSLDAFAGGIRLALVTTILGLSVAIPSLFAFQFLKHRLLDLQREALSWPKIPPAENL